MTDALPPPHVIDSPLCTAEVYDHGAQVIRWAPRGAEPVLYLSTAAELEAGSAIRGGVPVCWPWFGPGREPGMEPSHGFLRTTPWRLERRTDHQDGSVELVHRITSDDVTSPHWPQPYAVELRSRLGTTLEISLTTSNTGEEPIDYEEAMHAYLSVGDAHQMSIDGLVGKSFYDKIFKAERRQTGRVRLSGETDAVYRTTGGVTIDDPASGRRLRVTTTGMSDIVVWNPGERKAREISDIGDGEWQRFVCVEGANVLGDAVTLGPGGTHTSTYRVEVLER